VTKKRKGKNWKILGEIYSLIKYVKKWNKIFSKFGKKRNNLETSKLGEKKETG
jgi:hypothetical protein